MGLYLYKDASNASWYELDEERGTFKGLPFGQYVCVCLNTLNSFESKERFLRNESTWIKENDVIARTIGLVNENGQLQLEEWWNTHPLSNKELWWSEYQDLLNLLTKLELVREKENANEYIFALYDSFKYFPVHACIKDFFYFTKENRNTYFDEHRDLFVKSAGYEIIKVGETLVPCEKYFVRDVPSAFILDFWEWLFNPQSLKIRTCKECGILFCSNNVNATYCPLCKKNMGKIRYQARKKNVERKLHQEILSMLYTLDDTKELSNAFLNESNYYWDIVSGKDVEKNPAYKKRIKTKEDYMKWLQEQKKAYKKRKE